VKAKWYPGSMARAIRLLKEDLRIVDLVVELLDSRIPFSSRNPALSKLIQDKKRLTLLHKADRSEPDITARWLSFFKQQQVAAMPFSVHTAQSAAVFFKYLERQGHNLRSGRVNRPLRLMIIGIPNVGKSSLINHLVKRSPARTGNRPGITRGRQWVRLLDGVELLDTPGILWPHISEKTMPPLAVVGALPVGGLDLPELSLWLIAAYLKRGKAEQLFKRYPFLQPGEPEMFLEKIGAGLGFLQTEGKVDLHRTAVHLLSDFQSGALGRISLEVP